MNKSLSAAIDELFRFGIWSELSNLFRMLSELSLLLIWIIALVEGQISWGRAILVLGIIYIFSHFLARTLHYLKWKIIFQRLIYFLWIITGTLISTRMLLFKMIDLSVGEFLGQIFRENLTAETITAFWVLLFTFIVIMRGVQAARYPVTAREMTGGLRLRIIFFALYAVIFAKDNLEIFLPVFFLFLLFSLASLSLARVADLSDSVGGRLPGFNLQWASGIGVASLIVILLSRVISWIINLRVAEFLGSGLIVLLQLIFGLVVLVTSPILLAVFSVIEFLFQLLAPNLSNILNETELDAGAQLLEDFQGQVTDATQIDPRLFVMIGVLLLIVIIAVIQLRWKPWQRMLLGEDGSSEINPNIRLSNPLKNLFPNRAQRRKRASARSLIAAARIRYIYAQLMDLCERLGKPRPRSFTPNEFLPRLYNIFPLYKEELDLITNAYVKIRYGELPETSKDIAEVLDGWERINAFGKEILDERAKRLRRTPGR